MTNAKEFAANDTGSLKALADDRADRWAGLKTPVLYQGFPNPGDPTSPIPHSDLGRDFSMGNTGTSHMTTSRLTRSRSAAGPRAPRGSSRMSS